MDSFRIDALHLLNSADEDKFWRAFEKTLAFDDGAAAKEHLAAGRPITYRDPQHANQLVREWPDGRREVIQADINGGVSVLRYL